MSEEVKNKEEEEVIRLQVERHQWPDEVEMKTLRREHKHLMILIYVLAILCGLLGGLAWSMRRRVLPGTAGDSTKFDEAMRIDQAMIGTIHSVAQALIKKYWFFLGLSPDMGVMDEDDTNFYVSQSLADLPTNKELRKLHAFCEDFGIQAAWGSDKRGLDYDFWKSDIQRIISYTTNYEVNSYERSIQESLGFIRQFVDSNIKSSYTKEELTAVLKVHQEFIDSQPDSDANRKRQTVTSIGQ